VVPIGTGALMRRTITMGPIIAARAITARRTVGPSMTATFVAIARGTIAVRRALAAHMSWAFVGVFARAAIAVIASPMASAFFPVTIAVAITITWWRAHFIAVVVARTKSVMMRWTVETTIG
jgi:hypothetical protein